MPDIRDDYEGRRLALHHVADSLSRRTSESLREHRHIDRVAFRVKGTASFVAKATSTSAEGAPRYERPLVEVEDQVAGRVIVFCTADLAPVKEVLMTLFRSIEVASRKPRRDDEFGYQSEHLILAIPPWAKPRNWSSIVEPPNTFELQLRTLFMHAYAEPQHDIAYKAASDLTPEVRRELAWIAASAWGADAAFARIRAALGAKGDPNAPISA